MNTSQKLAALVLILSLGLVGLAQAKPNYHPVGTIRYDPEKTWNSYVILAGVGQTAKLIDRNGNLVHEWDLQGSSGMPNKVYPGGHLLTSVYPGWAGGIQDGNTVAILDFESNILRKFNHFMEISDPPRDMPAETDGSYWISRQHHDYQIQGDPVGYYAPEVQADLENGNLLILAHRTTINPIINNDNLQDDVILVVDKDERILFEWSAADHFEEFGLQNYPEAMTILRAKSGEANRSGQGSAVGYDWFHINCASWIGPNQWYDQGDTRFHPDNIIADSRETGHVFIIDHISGNVVWQIAPPFEGENEALGPIIGVHHSHMIPKGLPGAGNILIFNNGGMSTYFPELFNYYSRVTEFNPVTKEIVWEYSALNQLPNGLPWFRHADSIFFSPYISSAQRLPNGNTLIDEGSSARLFELTPDLEIVWEYYSPYHYFRYLEGDNLYRAYAVPYDYVPQLTQPREVAVIPPPREIVVLPDIEGNLPNLAPSMDTNSAFQYESLAPILIPGLEIKD